MPSSPELASPQLTGEKLGRYTLGPRIGKGAFGDVYAATAEDGARVAVKLLDAQAARSDEVVARFRREAETQQRLEHPNIVRVLDVGSARGRQYLVMELVSGGSLRQLLERGAPAARTVPILADVARALAHAHAEGVVHRDVKPENVLLTRSGRARVADFGLARAADQTGMTTDGRVLGTANYMSPEQVRGGKATAASDVYALGIILYEAVSGRRPFDAEQPIALMYQHAEVEPAPPRVRRPYPASLGELALACLAKDPAQRPTMRQVADRLARARLARRRLWPVSLAALTALAVLVVAVPGVLNPLCGHWFGGGAFRSLRGGAQTAHHAIFGGSEPAAKPQLRQPPHHAHRPGRS